MGGDRTVIEPSHNERAAQMIGRVLSERYRVDELIAAGSMAAVYLGLHLKMRKQVAIKILHPSTENFPELVTRFEREAVAGAHISHPNVAAASDMGTFDDGSYFLVLEHVKGRTLRQVITESGPMSPARVIHLGRQLAAALGAAHAKGIIHRDLKPRNVMVTDPPEEVLKLIDFGLARVEVEQVAPLDEDVDPSKKPLSAAGVVFGTVGYMAPETALGMSAVDERSDLYSLGVILYEMLVGERPFTATDSRDLFMQHRSERPVPPSERTPKIVVPPVLERLVMALLEKDPAARPPNTDAVIAELDEISVALEGTSDHVVSLPRQRIASRHVAMIAGAALVAVLGVAWIVRGRAGLRDARKAVPPPTAASAAPAPSGTGAPVDPSSFGARNADDAALDVKLRDELLASHDDADAGAILVELANVAPNALRDPALRRAATELATRAGETTGPEIDRVFYVLTYKLGPEGLDVLYDVRSGGATKAALRAAAILEHQGTSDRASPPLRVALELSKAACRQKPFLFSRAGTDGDARALAVLTALAPPACDPKTAPCCFRHNLDLERAIATLTVRLGR